MIEFLNETVYVSSMQTGNIIALIVLPALAIFAIYYILKTRREARELALRKKHGPPTGTPELDRAAHIQNGGLGYGGLEP